MLPPMLTGRLVVAVALVALVAASALRPAARAAENPPGGPDPKPGANPRDLTDAEKAAKLAEFSKLWDDNRRNQDLIPVRTRRNGVISTGDMHYPPAAKFLRRVFDDDRDMTTRVAALVAIGKCGDFETTEGAVRTALANTKKEPVFAASLPRMFQGVEDEKSREWIVTRLDHREDAVVASVVEAVGVARQKTAMPHLEKLLASSKDPAVRFECLRALGLCGGKDAIRKLVPFLADPDWRLRMGAVEGLGFTQEPQVIADVAAKISRAEEPIVAETAIEALIRIGGKDVVEPLIGSLKVGRLRARQKARAALRRIAKDLYQQEKDYSVDPNAWNSWWKKVKAGVNPDDPAYTRHETTSYFNFPVESDRVLFILDVSGSMVWPDAPRDSGIKPADWKQRRIDIAHKELFAALKKLAAQNRGRLPKKKADEDAPVPDVPSEEGTEPPTLFNVATFAGVVTPWQKEAVLATEENADAAVAWLGKQLPRGGTATFDALAFGIDQLRIDTVYFLSDGVPSLGRFEERETILAELRRLNRFRRISINTIALIVGLSPIEKARKYEDPADMADLMSRIALENQGRFANESKQ